MEAITGALIRHHRLQKNISQEGLCKGICVVSYLSKIESGSVNAQEDIIHQLFSVLKITYHDDATFLKQYKTIISKFFTGFFLEEEGLKEQKAILDKKIELLNSPLFLSFQLVQGYVLLANIAENEIKIKQQLAQLKPFLHMMSEDESFLYYYLSGSCSKGKLGIQELEKAGQFKTCSVQKHALGYANYAIGQFGEAIDCLRIGYDLACDEGNAHMMLQNALFLGNCYSITKEEQLMMKYYSKCELLIRTMHGDHLYAILQYNIGASYLKWGYLDKAEQYLKSSLIHKNAQDYEAILTYQKLTLLYYEKKDTKQMLNYMKKADQELKEDACLLYKSLNQFVHLYCSSDAQKHEECIKILERICYDEESEYGFRSFHARYLGNLYIEKRRYKEAYLLSKHFRL